MGKGVELSRTWSVTDSEDDEKVLEVTVVHEVGSRVYGIKLHDPDGARIEGTVFDSFMDSLIHSRIELFEEARRMRGDNR